MSGPFLQPMVLFLWMLVSSSAEPTNSASVAPVFRIEPDNTFSKGLQYYRALLLDKDTKFLYIGAMNHVYKLWAYKISDTANRNTYAERELLPSVDAASECGYQQEHPEYRCQNHVRVLLKQSNDTVYVCSTNAYNPQVVALDMTSLNVRQSGQSGAAICPVDPDDNGTAVWVTHGNPANIASVYAGTVTSKTQTDRIIYRPQLKDPVTGFVAPRHKFMRTMHTDSKWLNNPDFVGSFDLGEYVYFFFREPAVEFMNCGKGVYSRVARVCKNDVGGENVLQQVWTTFLKARLNCSLPGEFPFYFDEIQAVEKVVLESEVYFYATFTTTLNGFYGSALCMFSLRDINQVFDRGQFKEQESSVSAWLPVPPQLVPVPRPGQCVPDTRAIADGTLNFVTMHPLMDGSISSFAAPRRAPAPLFYKRDIVFGKLVVDVVEVAGRVYHVIFAATANGELYKVLQWVDDGGQPMAKLLAVYRLPQSLPVRAMHILSDEYVYVAQDPVVSQIAVDQCSLYRLCASCAADPYCSWNNVRQTCTRAQESHQFSKEWIQISPSDPSRGGKCQSSLKQHKRTLYPGDTVHLQCDKPAGTDVSWSHNKAPLALVSGRHLLTVDSDLVLVNISAHEAGTYECIAQSQALVSYQIDVDDVNCQKPQTVQAYQSVYREWCREFHEYRKLLYHWKQTHESQCSGSRAGDKPQLDAGSTVLSSNRLTDNVAR